MDIKTMKRIAEQELFRYQEHNALLLKVWEAGGHINRLPCAAWVRAINGARAHFAATDPKKEAFFADYYQLDRARMRRTKRSMAAMAMLYHMSESALRHWRNEFLTVTIMAAIQTGALKPFRSMEQK